MTQIHWLQEAQTQTHRHSDKAEGLIMKTNTKTHRHSDEALAEEESGNYETAGETLPDPSFRNAQLRMTFHNK